MKILSQVWNGIKRGVLICAFGIVIYALSPLKFMRCEGTSMGPSKNGRLSLLVDYNGQALHVGEVIVFIHPDGVLCGHRIIKVIASKNGDERYYLTKGDANDYVDPLVEKRQIVARVLCYF